MTFGDRVLKLDVRGSVYHSIIHIENPTRCNSVSKVCYIYIYIYIYIYMKLNIFRATRRPHEEPKTAIAASGFACVEGCWTCSCWTLSGRV